MASIWSGKIATTSWQKRIFARRAFYDALRAGDSSPIQTLDEACAEAAKHASVVAFAEERPDRWGRVGDLGPCVATWARRHNLDLLPPWFVTDMIVRLIDREQPERHGQRPSRLLWAVLGNTSTEAPDPEGLAYGRMSTPELGWKIGLEDQKAVRESALESFTEQLDFVLGEMDANIRAIGAAADKRTELGRSYAVVGFAHREPTPRGEDC